MTAPVSLPGARTMARPAPRWAIRRPPALSIRWRLTLWYTAVLALSMTVFSLTLYWYLGTSMIRDIDALSQERALQVEDMVDRALRGQQAAAFGLLDPRYVETLRLQGVLVDFDSFDPFRMPGVGVRVWDQQGMIITASEELQDTTRPAIDYQPILYALHGHVHRYVLSTEDGPFYSYCYPSFFVNGRPAAVIQILTSLRSYEGTMERLASLLAGGTLLAALLALFTGAALAQTALRSIETITRTAQRINRAQDLSRRIPLEGPRDEIGRLTETINEMLDRIEDIFQTQRQFLADVSHELRTPLTTVRGEIELMERAGCLDPEGLAAVRDESERMSRLVGDLLLLARDEHQARLDRQPVELDTLLLEVFRQAQRLAGEARTVSLGHEDAATVLGERDRLKQLLLNLVHNALTHTPPGTRVRLSLYREGDTARLEVADDGPGIPAEHLPHLFERFYRPDKSRSRARGGTGLGLAIVKWLAVAHGGDVQVSSRPGAGATFTVRLPLAPGERDGASPATATGSPAGAVSPARAGAEKTSE